jgi:lipoprotein-anchoring transpeptidase ErfK/SrfK
LQAAAFLVRNTHPIAYVAIFAALSAAPAEANSLDRPTSARELLFFQPAPDPAPADAPAKPRAHKSRHNDTEIAGTLPAPTGPLAIVVSIARQRVTLFSDGKKIAEAPVSTGTVGHETPMGVFAVISKARYHESNLYSSAPMPFMERITWSGIALHEGPLPGHAASHGCIRLPGSFAASLFKITKVGARVIIVRDRVAPVEVKSARLFVPKPVEEKPKDVSAASPSTTGAVQVADAHAMTVGLSASTANDHGGLGAPVDIVKLPGKPLAALPDPAKPIGAQKRNGPVQVFVSRKTFAPLFDAAVTITDPDKAWGTHVFTAMEIKDKDVRWTAVTIPSGTLPKPAGHGGRKLPQKEIERRERLALDLATAPSATEALERFEMPQDARDRISELLAPGSSLIVSDNALSDETGSDTDFVVATH